MLALSVLFLLVSFLLGLAVGSFLNVCIYRWPRDESVVRPRSRCPHCGAAIAWRDLVPLISYVSLRGRCRHCRGPISVRYPVVELLNGLLYAYLFWNFGAEPLTGKLAVFGSMMLILIFTDLSEFILPDEITLGGLALGLALSPFIHLDGMLAQVLWFFMDVQPAAWVTSFTESCLAALILGGLLWVVGEVYYRVRHLEGLGLGDVKMMAMVGAFWGISDGFTTLILGAVVGAVSGVLIVIAGRKKWDYALPFGSYLGATALIVSIWGDDILSWYSRALSSGAPL